MRKLLAIGLAVGLAPFAAAQAQEAGSPSPQISQPIDDGVRVTLAGNTRPEVHSAADRGAVSDNYPLPHMLLQLKRSPERERALANAIDAMYDPASPQFHRWLDRADIGARYGLPAADLQKVSGWLSMHGFTVNVVYDNGVLIDFSGDAGQVREAFHTEIHEFDLGGARHLANVSDPDIPAALAPAVAGVVSLHDFKPRKAMRPKKAYTNCDPLFGCSYEVTPSDLATIYDFNPAFAAGYTGLGQTIVLIEDTDIYSAADWRTFRAAFGLNTAYPHGTLTQAHPRAPRGKNNCANPGVNADDVEATLDVEWASAAAPNATIELAACADTTTTFGGLIAMQNLIGAATHPSILSVSYSECETMNGAAANAAFNQAYMQAAAEGISVFVATGDQLTASCDYGNPAAMYGVTVSGMATTPYNVAVGGTDFAVGGQPTSTNYWSNANSTTHGSALSYIPEIPWNSSCASTLLSRYYGYSSPIGPNGFCNSFIAQLGFQNVAGASGGPSACATGVPAVAGVVGGTCKGYSKPKWQHAQGVPGDGVRDIPDVSLFASDGAWGVNYIFCFSDPNNGGTPCTGGIANWSGAGGTSFATPILAGMQALVNQATGAAQGNPNPVFYALANAQNAAGASACVSSNPARSASCVFNNVTSGDIFANCIGTSPDCAAASGTLGLLGATSGSTTTNAYPAHAGWNFATGIGSVNAYNLVKNWPAASNTTAEK